LARSQRFQQDKISAAFTKGAMNRAKLAKLALKNGGYSYDNSLAERREPWIQSTQDDARQPIELKDYEDI
jgi:hypothetical protein